ncbi:hypothetical protein J2786_003615 [Chryseobacterium vietnamense]|uniref:Uncharacterized protein n=1 Tax=Chryseobacterium vietnamense TaxID=866785 RepID=A0ACC6JC03_9FLAO|nr:hypothetical protein [Chryseobacterium vietnamense]MDR6460481.1 hypothetical protein [Chryseobacterium vietnamense]
MSKNNFTKIGFDYGVKPFFILLGDMEFSDLFKKADCRGVVYIFRQGENEEEMIPVQMAFMFQNEEPAEKFMDNLLGWISKSNDEGDAVSMEFIENNEGGYTIAISPEIDRFHNRMIPKNLRNRVTPIFMVQTHFKKIDTLGQNYLNFKANYSKADGIAIGYVIGNANKIIKQSKKYFIKKDFHFCKQDDISNNSTAMTYKAVKGKSSFDPSKLPKPPKESIEKITERRVSEMKSLLPLTYNKLNNLWLGDIQKKLSETYDFEIIKQAICNLTIFERLKQMDNLSPDFTKEGYPNRIQEYLLGTYESFDSYYPSDDFYTEELIVNQVKNDQRELENYLKK